MTDQKWQPRMREGIKLQHVDDEAIVLDRENERVHQLNPVGSFILERCDGSRTAEEIVEDVVAHYEVETDRADADTSDLLGRMKALGVLV